jgi:hypothetical protein
MAAFYLLADETVQNQQQQDCRLIVEISALTGPIINVFTKRRKSPSKKNSVRR